MQLSNIEIGCQKGTESVKFAESNLRGDSVDWNETISTGEVTSQQSECQAWKWYWQWLQLWRLQYYRIDHHLLGKFQQCRSWTAMMFEMTGGSSRNVKSLFTTIGIKLNHVVFLCSRWNENIKNTSACAVGIEKERWTHEGFQTHRILAKNDWFKKRQMKQNPAKWKLTDKLMYSQMLNWHCWACATSGGGTQLGRSKTRHKKTQTSANKRK